MQPLGYLSDSGILNFDANAFLNSPTPMQNMPYGNQLGIDGKMQGQPTKDGFFSSKKGQIVKKVAAGAIIATLAVLGFKKCKTGVNKLTTAVKTFLK